MIVVATQVGPDLAIRQGGIGPIVTLSLGVESAPAVLADAPDGGTPANTDAVLIRRQGALVTIQEPAFVAGLSAEAAQAAIAAVASELSVINGDISSIDTTLTIFGADIAAINEEIAAGVGTPSTVLSVLSYGADPTGVKDSAPAIEAALAAMPAAGGQIYLPPGDYAIASPIVIDGKPVMIAGAGRGLTRLHFQHNGIGFDIAPGTVLSAAVLRDFTAWAEYGSGPSAAVARVTYPVQSSGYETVAIEGVDVRGYPNAQNGQAPYPQTWLRGFILVNAWKPRLRDCAWFGPPSAAGATSSAFLEVSGCYDTRIDGANVQYGGSAIVQSGYCEGVRLRGSVVINTDHVLIQTAQTGWTGYAPGWVSLLDWRLVDCELNVTTAHVVLAGATIGFVVGCDITRNSGPAGAQVLFNLTDVSQMDVVGCNVDGGGASADIAFQFQAVVNSSANVLTSLRFNNMATALPIVGGNGTVALLATGLDVGNVPIATAVIDQSVITSGNRIELRGHASASNPSGPASVRDFVWLSAVDWTVLDRVKSIAGAANYIERIAATAGNPPTIQFTGADGTVNGVVQTKGGALFLSAAGDGVSGSLGQFLNLAGATQWPVFQNATTGNLSVIETNAGGLAISPAQQLYLGGTAIYSVTIGGVTTNPGSGAANKLWSNGGVVSLARTDGLNPLPTFQPPFIPQQVWSDLPGSAAIFSHNGGIVPTPPAPQTGLLFGDRDKLRGPYNFADVWNAQSTAYDAWPTLQNYLLYAQLMRLAQMGQALDSVAERAFVDVYLAAGDYLVSQPLIVPEGVRLGGPGRICRTPWVGQQSLQSPGPFATNQYLPTVVVAPKAHLSDLNIYVNQGNNFAYRGSGVCLGKNWVAVIGQPVTVGAGGAGYSVGDYVTMASPSAAPYYGWTAQVTAVDGGGAITAASIYFTGCYALPPAATMYSGAAGLQETQWTAANGFSVFDPAHASCFLVAKAYKSDFVTPSPGTGASLKPVWAADYTVGGQRYNIGSAILVGIQAGRIQVTGGIPSVFSSEYGPTFGVMLTGLEFEIDSIQIVGGNAGVYGAYAQDVRISRWNIVEAACPFILFGCGSWHAPLCVFDTCGSLGVIDQSHGIHARGRAFWEPGNVGIQGPLINTQTAPDGAHYALIIGGNSSQTYPNADLDIEFTLEDMGGLPASTIALYPSDPIGSLSPSQQKASCFLQYVTNSRIQLRTTNYSAYGAAGGTPFPNPTLFPTSGLFGIGYSVDPSVELRGSLDTIPTIDGVAAPAQIVFVATGGGIGAHAFPLCETRVWDGLHQCWIGPAQLAEIIGAGAPTNGTTGAGFAGPGSSYINTTSGAGRRYVNGGTLAAPTWS